VVLKGDVMVSLCGNYLLRAREKKKKGVEEKQRIFFV